MQILVIGFPADSIGIFVNDKDEATDETFVVEEKRVWHRDFLDTVTNLQEKYNVDEIIGTGPEKYIDGLIEPVQEYYRDNDDISIMTYPFIKRWEEGE